MLRTLVLLSAALFATAGLAEDTHGWYPVYKLGYSYLMPPMSCFAKPMPGNGVLGVDYFVEYVPQDILDGFLPPNTPAGIHLFGEHQTVNGIPIEYISDSLPWLVALDVEVHEDAHLRGCEHDDKPGPG